MIADAFKCYIQSTYRKDIFDYKVKTLGKICAWGDKWQPDSIQLFKQILRRIKNKKKVGHYNDKARKNGWYVTLPILKTKKHMAVFFEYPVPPKNVYTIYDFKITD